MQCIIHECENHQSSNVNVNVCTQHQGKNCSECGAGRVHDMWCSWGCNGVLVKCEVVECKHLTLAGFNLCKLHYDNPRICRQCANWDCQICHICSYNGSLVIYRHPSGWCESCWGPMSVCRITGCNQFKPRTFPLCHPHDQSKQWCRQCAQLKTACRCFLSHHQQRQ